MANLRRFVGCPESNFRQAERLAKSEIEKLSKNSELMPLVKIGNGVYKRMKSITI